MATATWQCSANGRYWLDVLVGSLQVSLMIDTGLVDPEQRVGIELEPHLFDIHVARGVAGVPSRVGLAFFHKLSGCRVVWDCPAKTWSISAT